MDFRTFARTLMSHWKLVAGALLACLVGAAAVTVFQTKSYQSSATVLISFSGETDLTQVFQGTQAAQERLSSYAAVAGGHAVAERAVNQLHLSISPDEVVSQTQVTFTPKSTLFTITVSDTDPKRAAALAEGMAEQFTTMVGSLGANPKSPGAPATTTTTPAPQPDGTPAATGDPQPTTSPTAQLPVARATVVEHAGIPDAPYKPVPSRNMAMGLVAGVLLGIGVALTREAMDRTVRTREKLEQLSGLRTLGELPGQKGSAPRYGTDISFDDAVRGFRARLLRAMGPDARRVLAGGAVRW